MIIVAFGGNVAFGIVNKTPAFQQEKSHVEVCQEAVVTLFFSPPPGLCSGPGGCILFLCPSMSNMKTWTCMLWLRESFEVAARWRNPQW